MDHSGKRLLTEDEFTAVLDAAGIPAASVRSRGQLPFGTYNTVYRLEFADRAPLLLKVPPDPRIPALAYERDLLVGEAVMFREAAAQTGVAVPEVLALDPDGSVVEGGYLLMTECPGTPWHQAPGLGPADRERLRRELGGVVARLHTAVNPDFGYPSRSVPPAADWRGTFTAMLEALLSDADRFGVTLPAAPERIRALLAAAGPALGEVAVPRLCHFDLWEGNILVEGAGERARVGALIDGERMFWGDPLAEFASLNLFSAADAAGEPADPALLAGYREAGGAADFDDAAHVRMALYRAYLYLIMLIEGVPRGFPAEGAAEREATVAPLLLASLDVVASRAACDVGHTQN